MMNKENKNLIFRLLTFGFIFMVAFLLFNSWFVNWRYDSWQVHEIDEEINSKDFISYLFVGDSHVDEDINDEYILNSLNFGIPGESALESYYRLATLLEKNISIDSVILEVDTHRFFKPLDESFNEEKYYEQYLSLDKMAEISGREKKDLYMDRYFPSIGFGSSLITYTDNLLFPKTSTGIDKNFEELAKRSFKSQFSESLNPSEVKYFHKIVNLTLTNNISVIFIQYPLSSAYIDGLSSHNISYFEVRDDILDVYGDSILFLDYAYEYYDDLFMFRDSHHLSEMGSINFSKKVCCDLKNESLVVSCEDLC